MLPGWTWKPFVHLAVTGRLHGLHLEPLSPPPARLATLGLYLHVPFCRRLCPFCPYHRVRHEPEAFARFERAVRQEIDLCAPWLAGSHVSSLYVGGGTPTIDSAGFLRILHHMRTTLPAPGEICVELHPSHMDGECLAALREAGTTQVSVGVESLCDATLVRLGRNHSRQDALDSLQRATAAGFDSVNADLMFAIPGQSLEEWTETVTTTLEMGVDQLSTYPLFSFPYSDLGRERGLHKVTRPATRTVLAMLARTQALAARQGFERCAVWSWRRPGKKKFSSITRHHYLGFGPSAASMTGTHFYVNTFDIRAYAASLPKRRPVAVGATLDRRLEMAYWLYWRIYELHVDRDGFTATFGPGETLDGRFGHLLRPLCHARLLAEENWGYRVTEAGAFRIHRLQNEFSLNYINRLWGRCRREAWPAEVTL
jgi:coproporphyrinogen III oxidase-like Fe-S oxidoreductase